ncbi:hypothetical protein J4411_00465 [Candidatus Pacearchaeota archaeon]|nr:hypothetical protein [uncultured archaeon]MBS3084371.1 hypothetical protein [Candidatus Pacearchaeota archaeon]
MKTQIRELGKKGQVGETLTWIVATLLVIILLIFFIFGSSLLGKTKKLGNTFRESLTSSQTFEGTDPLLKKSLFAYVTAGSDLEKINLDREIFNLANRQGSDLDYNETKKNMILRYAER